MPWGVSFALVFASLILLFVIGVPIGFAMIIVSMGGLFLVADLDYVLNAFTSITYSKSTPYVFIAIPLFVLMTEFMTRGGTSTKLIDIALKLMGRMPGGLAVVTVAASTIFGACCSSTVIGAMVMGEMIYPEADKRKYNMSLISGTIAAGGTLSVLIPPSGTFILWGIITGVSVGDLFIAGIIPGVITGTIFIAYIMIRAIRNPAMTPAMPVVPIKEKAMAVIKGWDVILLITVTIGGIYGGVATVTEIAAVGAFFALIIGLFNRKLSLKQVWLSAQDSAGMVAIFVVLLIGAFLLIHLMTYLEIPQNLSRVIIEANLSKLQLVVASMVMFFILGLFIDATSVVLITMPLFLPVMKTMEVDLLWLGVVVTINSMVATLTPPVGLNLFVIQSIGKKYGVSFVDVVRGTAPFIILLFIVMLIIFSFPSLATWLPSTMN